MKAGSLVLVATPIGNLGDISPRAKQALEAADLIACEDTRRTRQLLSHLGIVRKKLLAVHAHNEATQSLVLIASLKEGNHVALVTDSGTPGISDPGERVVAAAAAEGISVGIIPGPSAVVSALAISGLPTSRFVFEGFLPRKGKERKDRLSAIAEESRTVVLYESPHHLVKTIRDLTAHCDGERPAVIVKELTKIHETVWRGALAKATDFVDEAEPRGEYVIMLGAAPARQPASDKNISEALDARLANGEDKKTAIAAVAKELDVPKRVVYEIAHIPESKS